MGRRPGLPAGPVADCLQNANHAVFGGVVNPELDGILPGQSRSFADRGLSRKILLELSRGSHAVIAKSNCKWRGFLANLESPAAPLGKIQDPVVYPRIRKSVDGRADWVGWIFYVRSRHRRQTRDQRAHRTIVLHGRHVMIDLVPSNFAV